MNKKPIFIICRNPSLNWIIPKAIQNGFRKFQVFPVPKLGEELGKSNVDSLQVILQTTSRRRDFVEFETRTFLASLGRKVDLMLSCVDPEVIKSPDETLVGNLGGTLETFQQLYTMGLISGFGISSNAFSNGQLSSSLVESVNPGSAFKFVQLPANILETSGIDGEIPGWARKKGFEVITDRPLTAFDEKGSWRLVDSPFPLQYSLSKDRIIHHLTPPAGSPPEQVEACLWLSNLISNLDEQLSSFSSVIHWETELSQTIFPMILDKLEELDTETYELLTSFFNEFGLAVKEAGGQNSRMRILEKYPKFINDTEFENRPLQQTALEFVMKHPKSDSVAIHVSTEQQLNDLKIWC